jgi:hypothetical protein
MRFFAYSAVQELNREREVRLKYFNAYQRLYVKYGKKVTEVHGMATKCLSLYEELEKSETIHKDCASGRKVR